MIYLPKTRRKKLFYNIKNPMTTTSHYSWSIEYKPWQLEDIFGKKKEEEEEKKEETTDHQPLDKVNKKP